jgi:chemotaxis protein CheX
MISSPNATLVRKLFPPPEWSTFLQQAAAEVFSMMVGAEVTPVNCPQAPGPAGVTAMVGLAGELCGVLTVRCGEQCATNVASKMLGIEISDAGPQKGDAIGEICNMVAGSFKAKIDGMEDRCMLSVPTVITGHDYELHTLAAGERLAISLTLEGETIWMVLDLRT